MTTNARIPARDGEGEIPAYLATPASSPTAGIIVIPEIFGVNAGVRKKCDNWAARGYVAIAPDIFWRFSPGTDLDPDIEAGFKQGIDNMMQYETDDGVRDIQSVADYLRHSLGIEKVGVVGFCLGGKLAYLAATRTDVDASVGYYGVGIDQMLGESHAIANPLLLHVPTADHFVSPEAQKAMHQGLDEHPRVTLHDYEGLDHGFAVESGKRRNDPGAKLADERTAEFFATHLNG